MCYFINGGLKQSLWTLSSIEVIVLCENEIGKDRQDWKYCSNRIHSPLTLNCIPSSHGLIGGVEVAVQELFVLPSWLLHSLQWFGFGDLGEDFMSDVSGMSMPSSLAPSPTPSDDSSALSSVKQCNKSASPHRLEKGSKRRLSTPAISSFLDMSFWKR